MADEQEKERYDQEKIMSAIKHLESNILDALKSKDPLWWRITQIILPIILTAILGLIVWRFQSNIQITLNERSSLLHAQLALQQHLYERRIVAYQELYDKALKIQQTLKEIPTNYRQENISARPLDRNTIIMSELITTNKIILSEELNELLFQIWYDTSKIDTRITTEELMEKIADQMRKDLFVDKLRIENIFK